MLSPVRSAILERLGLFLLGTRAMQASRDNFRPASCVVNPVAWKGSRRHVSKT